MPILPLSKIASSDVEQLLNDAFGTDRHGRTAYLLRDGTEAIDTLSIGWVEYGRLIGSVQCWPVQLNTDKGDIMQLIMVGPVAVQPDYQSQGIGKKLMTETMKLHDGLPKGSQLPMMMIGDQPYYGEWGFSADHTGGWRLPGPVDPDRLLMRWTHPAELNAAGMIAPSFR